MNIYMQKWWSRASWSNFMLWSNFCVLVWLHLPWRDFITLSDIIRKCGHVMYEVVTLWCSRESWYYFFSVLDEIFVLVGFCLSWCHFRPWCNQANLGMIFPRFGYNYRCIELLFILVFFDILVWLTASWYDFLHFARLFRLSVILFDLIQFYILVRLTASWCDLCVLDINIFCALVFYSCMQIFIFTHAFTMSCTGIQFLAKI